MKYVSPTKIKVLIMMFFGVGIVGIYIGLEIALPESTVYITLLGVINVSLGAFFVWVHLVQEPKPQDKRKKKRRDRNSDQ